MQKIFDAKIKLKARNDIVHASFCQYDIWDVKQKQTRAGLKIERIIDLTEYKCPVFLFS